MEETKGVIYILTNPSFEEYVKIGYADDLAKRLKQLNRSECTPFTFRVYATYEVNYRLSDLKIHEIIDKLNPNLRAIDNFEGKKKIREFYAMTKEDAYGLLKSIAEINGTPERVKLISPTQEEKKDEKLAETIRKGNFSFSGLGIKPGEELTYIHDRSIVVKVVDDRTVDYNGEIYYLSNLAKKLLNRKSLVQGTLHFAYKGEVLTDLRGRLGK